MKSKAVKQLFKSGSNTLHKGISPAATGRAYFCKLYHMVPQWHRMN